MNRDVDCADSQENHPEPYHKKCKKKKNPTTHQKRVFIVKNEGNRIYLQKLKAELFLGMGELDQQTGTCFKLLVSSFKQHSWQSSSSSFMIFLKHPVNYHGISKCPFTFFHSRDFYKEKTEKEKRLVTYKIMSTNKNISPPFLPKTLIPLTLLQ